MVVFFHARSYFGVVPDWTRLGSRGVDIFFVISGFIMVYATRKLGNELSAVKSCTTFLGKRFIRVVPLYWLALIVTVYPYLFNWVNTGVITSDLITIFKDFAFIPHLSIDIDEKGEIFPALIQGWTLNYEVIFYLLFGLAILTRQYRNITLIVVLLGLVVTGRLHHFHYIPAIFYTNTILLEFVFGMILYEIYIKTQDLHFSKFTLWFIAITNDKVVLGAASAIIVWSFIRAFRETNYWLLKLLGDASFSIYLFHLTAFKLAREVVSLLSISPSNYFNIIAIIAIHAIISILVGVAIYFVIEKPLLKILRNAFDKYSQYRSNWMSASNRALEAGN